ncbi:transcriptional regulator [Cellulomonas chitinilytica]|uniref:Transcriptional regulator n=1 Tax=Cellulomonas chitinilytica TaxID=398759 RepID=A0A919P2F9_9CELL|nr:GAF and ANTAR domain-containing protein [Cellulomonas chitinilytica]GIG20224.1 transcriptional regulator [Cellulomonas chitinilytica]
MTDDREQLIVRSFVELAEGLASGLEAVDLLDRLAHSCVGVLDVASAGLLLADPLGRLHLLAASSGAARELEVFQVQRDEGPCRDCFHAGTPIDVPDLAADVERWPQFVPRALEAGFASVHAVPLRLRTHILGALGLFGTSTGTLDDDDRALAQALADVASVALVQERTAADQIALATHLQSALSGRVVLEQAKGVVAYAGSIDVSEAFDRLRQFAREHDMKLTDVATAVVARTLPAHEVLAGARADGVQ